MTSKGAVGEGALMSTISSACRNILDEGFSSCVDVVRSPRGPGADDTGMSAA